MISSTCWRNFSEKGNLVCKLHTFLLTNLLSPNFNYTTCVEVDFSRRKLDKEAFPAEVILIIFLMSYVNPIYQGVSSKNRKLRMCTCFKFWEKSCINVSAKPLRSECKNLAKSLQLILKIWAIYKLNFHKLENFHIKGTHQNAHPRPKCSLF